jgi:GntR family transcriptional regulator
VARKLGIQRGDVLLRFIAYLYTSAGKAVDYSFSYFLPGYFRCHVVRRVG